MPLQSNIQNSNARRTSTISFLFVVVAWPFLTANTLCQQSTTSPGDRPLPSEVSIPQAVEEALQNNLGLLAERVNLSIAEAARITARLKPNPVVSFGSDHLDVLGTRFNDINMAGPSELNGRIDFVIERGNKRQLRMATAEFGREIAEAHLLDSIRILQQTTTLTCLDVIQAKATLNLARDNLRTFEELVQTNTSRVKAGAIPPLELMRSQVAMLQFRSSVSRAELALSTAKVRLQNLLGRKTLSDHFEVLGELHVPLHQEISDSRWIYDQALMSRPDLHALELAQARSQSELKLQLAEAKVDYTWGAEYRRQQGLNGKGNSAGLFFSAPLPIHNRNQGEIARVRSEQDQLARQLEGLRAQVRTEVTTAQQEFQVARDLVESLERDLLAPAQQARSTAEYVYRAGGSSLIEFLDAQRAFNETMQSYMEAQAAYRRAVIDLNSTAGKEIIP